MKMNTQQQYFLTQKHKWTNTYELEPIAGKTWDWVGRRCPSMNTDFSDKETKRTNQKQRNYGQAAPSQNDKEIHTVPNNHHQKLRSLQNMVCDLHAHVTICDLTKT